MCYFFRLGLGNEHHVNFNIDSSNKYMCLLSQTTMIFDIEASYSEEHSRKGPWKHCDKQFPCPNMVRTMHGAHSETQFNSQKRKPRSIVLLPSLLNPEECLRFRVNLNSYPNSRILMQISSPYSVLLSLGMKFMLINYLLPSWCTYSL